MRFRDLEIHSHQRSGSHYIAALLCRNFLGTDDYLPYYKNHFIGNDVYKRVWENPDVGYVYVWRSREDVLRSMWNFRARLGMSASSESAFSNYPANSLWRQGTCNARYVGPRDTRATTGVSYYFRDVPVSLKQHWRLHKQFWEMLEVRDNVKLVKYDDLIGDFQGTMQDIADWLGSDRTEFEDIEKKIGWTCE